MQKFLIIDTHAVTPNLHEGSVEVLANDHLGAVETLTKRPRATLASSPWGPAPGVWFISALTGESFGCVVVQLDGR